MKGDFTRDTFDPEKHYSSVRMQQGRVSMDADWNEQVDIAAHRVEAETVDGIGGTGAPIGAAGFEISVPRLAIISDGGGVGNQFSTSASAPVAATAIQEALRGIGIPSGPPSGPVTLEPGPSVPIGLPIPGNLTIGAGRYYVDGILCENESAVSLSTQPDLPGQTPLKDPGLYLIYLDVWQRHLTALDDPSIRETALGGPDTATRAKTVCQVRALPIKNPPASASCATPFSAWDDLIAARTPRLKARANPGSASTDPCGPIPPGAGFRRLENQLYRVEIHTSGTLSGAEATATFKWSRDNGSIVTRWLDQNGPVLKVASTGRDAVLNIAEGQWVELIDDKRELNGQPGPLVKVTHVQDDLVTLDDPNGTIRLADFGLNPRMRRWDSAKDVAVTRPTPDGFIALESGVEVWFGFGKYQTGDYWPIPARTLTADVEWPRSGNNPEALPPHGVHHHYSRLAVVNIDSAGTVTVVDDCRKLFPPLTAVNTFFYLGGDGQEALPNPLDSTALIPLAQPLRAGVANGTTKSTVRFSVVQGQGSLQARDSTGQPTGPKGASVDCVATNGVAECLWWLDSTTQSQVVEANLLDLVGETVHLPIRYSANLSQASQVSYDPGKTKCGDLVGVTNVQDALDKLCAGDPGSRVLSLRWKKDKTLLRNDGSYPIQQLSEGIDVECDSPINELTVGRPTCNLVLQVPNLLPAPRGGPSPGAFGYTPIVLTAKRSTADRTLSWVPTENAITWLTDTLPTQVALARDTGALAFLELYGNFILTPEGLPLDADVFGKVVKDGVVATLPSGDKRKGGDLRVWVWLIPPPERLVTLSVTPTVITTPPSFTSLSVTGAVGLDRPADPSGVTVLLSSSNPALVSVPVSVSIGAAISSGTFTGTISQPVISQTQVTITATLGDVQKTAVVTLKPLVIESLVIDPPQTRGPQSKLTVTLNAPAPAGGASVSLTAVGPPTVTFTPNPLSFPAGTAKADANINIPASTERNPLPVKITATLGASKQDATLTVLPA